MQITVCDVCGHKINITDWQYHPVMVGGFYFEIKVKALFTEKNEDSMNLSPTKAREGDVCTECQKIAVMDWLNRDRIVVPDSDGGL